MRNIPARDRYVPAFGVVPGRDYRYICPLCGGGIDWPREPMDKNGCLCGLTDTDIAQALDCPAKKAALVVGALADSGYLDRSEDGYAIHDWYDYAGKLYDSREAVRQPGEEQGEKSAVS